jgi:diguanylate cyclase (GGDEF)-like protein
MWTILQKGSPTTHSAPPRPTPRPAGLRALARLWRGRRQRATPLSAGNKATSRDTLPLPADSADITSPGMATDISADMSPDISPDISTDMSVYDTAPKRALRTSDEYIDSLQTLRAAHAVLSADRKALDHSGQRQRERVADLEARMRFLHRTLDQPAARQSEPPPMPPLGSLPPLPPPPLPITDYPSAVVAAQHWQTLAHRLMADLQTMNNLVRIDSLTGLRNRRAFDEQLPREASRAQRVGEPFCLLLIDIDHFKRVNDAYGHPAGDAVLRSVASCIAACTRPSDHIARYGGEEFAVILSDVDMTQAMAVAERIRRKVQHCEHCPHQVTVSIGVAEYRPPHAYSETVPSHDELVVEADRALYAAKRGGRNRVHATTRRLSLH